MKVKALNGFVSTIDGIKYRVKEGDELDLPKGADWVQAGLVEVVDDKKKPSAAKNKKGDG